MAQQTCLQIVDEAPRAPITRINWNEAKRHYLAQNLARGPADPEYTFKDVSHDFGVSYKRVRTKAAEGHWRAEMRERVDAVTRAAIDAVQADAEASEIEIRRRQARHAVRLQEAAILILERFSKILEEDPDAIDITRPGVLNAMASWLRTGLQEERRALGLARVVERGSAADPLLLIARERAALVAQQHREPEGLADVFI